jgi:hypothetical protein
MVFEIPKRVKVVNIFDFYISEFKGNVYKNSELELIKNLLPLGGDGPGCPKRAPLASHFLISSLLWLLICRGTAAGNDMRI